MFDHVILRYHYLSVVLVKAEDPDLPAFYFEPLINFIFHCCVSVYNECIVVCWCVNVYIICVLFVLCVCTQHKQYNIVCFVHMYGVCVFVYISGMGPCTFKTTYSTV